MTALLILFFSNLILLCLLPLFGIIDEHLIKDKKKAGYISYKRFLRKRRISQLEITLLINSLLIQLIGLLTNNSSQSEIAFAILGMGMAYLFLTSYNRRMDTPSVKWAMFFISLISFSTGVIINTTEIQISDVTHIALYFPLSMFMYILSFRYLIKFISGTYPITLDRTLPLGQYYRPYQRKTNLWDMLWTLFNFIGLPLLIIIQIR